MSKNKAAFFDRDGTLIKDKNYLLSIDQVELISETVLLCRILQNAGYKIFVVTNQSGVARGFFTEESVIEVNNHIQLLLGKENVFIEKFYYCPHHPTSATIEKYQKNCFCRKPNPGMLLQACSEFDINMSESFMFGDKLLDVEAGIAAKCKSFFIQKIFESKVKTIEDLLSLENSN